MDINPALARFILDAAEVREKSFIMHDEYGSYTLTCTEAAHRVENEFDAQTAELVGIILSTSWNDVCEWAERVIKKRNDKAKHLAFKTK